MNKMNYFQNTKNQIMTVLIRLLFRFYLKKKDLKKKIILIIYF